MAYEKMWRQHDCLIRRFSCLCYALDYSCNWLQRQLHHFDLRFLSLAERCDGNTITLFALIYYVAISVLLGISMITALTMITMNGSERMYFRFDIVLMPTTKNNS